MLCREVFLATSGHIRVRKDLQDVITDQVEERHWARFVVVGAVGSLLAPGLGRDVALEPLVLLLQHVVTSEEEVDDIPEYSLVM